MKCPQCRYCQSVIATVISMHFVVVLAGDLLISSIQREPFAISIERLHLVPGELDNKEDCGHIGVPDKSISSKFCCPGTPTWRL